MPENLSCQVLFSETCNYLQEKVLGQEKLENSHRLFYSLCLTFLHHFTFCEYWSG